MRPAVQELPPPPAWGILRQRVLDREAALARALVRALVRPEVGPAALRQVPPALVAVAMMAPAAARSSTGAPRSPRGAARRARPRRRRRPREPRRCPRRPRPARSPAALLLALLWAGAPRVAGPVRFAPWRISCGPRFLRLYPRNACRSGYLFLMASFVFCTCYDMGYVSLYLSMELRSSRAPVFNQAGLSRSRGFISLSWA